MHNPVTAVGTQHELSSSGSSIRLAIAQINCAVGDMLGNSAKIIQYAQRASELGATIMLTPELALSGYSPEDLLLRDDFHQVCSDALNRLALALPAITVVVGHPVVHHGKCYNAASVLQDRRVIATYHKHVLPNHSVFDEVRYFTAGTEALVFEHQGLQFGVVICADVWESAPAKLAKKAGAEILLALNASPYHVEKQITRYEVARKRVAETGLPLVYANMVGGQDELVFDGVSFVMDSEGSVVQQLVAFEETIALVELKAQLNLPLNQLPLRQAESATLALPSALVATGARATADAYNPQPAQIIPNLELEPSVYQALCLGLHDYIVKNRFPGVLLGLSGGIDSALTLAIAVDALGADRVQVVMMPSEFTADMSIQDAAEMAKNLGVKYSELPIKSIFDDFRATLSDTFSGTPFDTAEENLQARIRGMLLMALSNKFGSIVLTTGNKSEVAVGYSTLYGDMAGGFSVLKDIPKTLVYKLAAYRNAIAPVIPKRIILRPPTAELRHGQLDQDSLPAYEILDAIMEAYVEHDCSRAEIIEMGYREQDVVRVTALIDRNEYKRRQAPLGVRITQRGFGKDRRYPITSTFVFNGTITNNRLRGGSEA